MKNLLLTTLFASLSFFSFSQTPCSSGTAGGYPCNGLTLQSYIPSSTFGAAESQDSWGWTDPQNGDEYAIVALDNGTAFVRITDPINPVYLGRLNTHTGSSLWRDVKVYSNHAYIVSDSNGNHGMQVFDLTQLRGLNGSPPQNFSETYHYGNFGSAHNIVINEDTGYAYVVGSNTYNGGPHFINLANPALPVPAGGYSGSGYTHDAQVLIYNGPDTQHNGKELMIATFSGASDDVRIIDVTDKSNVQLIGIISYTNKYYTHQGWFTEDLKYFIAGDEVDEENVGFNTRTLVFDMTDLDNPTLHYTHYGSTPAIDHNGYVKGNRFYLANYAAGMRMFKIDGLYDASPSMTEVAYFDTFTNNNNAAFNGTWNVYPYFESGNLVVTGFGNEYVNGDGGLFILKDPNYDNVSPIASCQDISVTLNKTTGTATISALDIDNGSTDNKGIVSRTIDKTTFTCNDVGTPQLVTLTVKDDYGNKSSCTAMVTVVGETTNYLGGGSWSNGSPDIGSNARISTNYNTSSSGSFSACTCEVDANKTLTVDAGDYIAITKDINVNGSIIVKHTGSVVQTDDNAQVNKDISATINVELTTPVLQTRDFMVLGSPMTTETRNGVFSNAFLVLKHTPANFIPHPGVPAGGTNFADDNGDNWNQMASGTINVGEGYIVRPQSSYTDPANTTYNMTYTAGTLNNGVISMPVVYNGASTNPDGTPNVYANPYPSAISAIGFINTNPLVNEVYFWEHLTPPSTSIPGYGNINFSMGDISMYNLSGGVKAANDPEVSTTPNGVIATGQGFGIKAFGAGTISFNNTMRLTTGNTTLRTPEDLVNVDRVWIEVKSNNYNLGSTALLAFNPNATSQLDTGFDSPRLATAISIFSHLEDGTEQLGIQTRETFDVNMQIPFGFTSQITTDETFTISLQDFDGINMEQMNVLLIDTFEDTVTNLSEQDYQFSSSEGVFNERFSIVFENKDVLNNPESILQAIILYPNPTNNLLTIFSPKTDISNIEVYDIRSRRLVDIVSQEENKLVIDMTNLDTAVYFIKINTKQGAITKRVTKY